MSMSLIKFTVSLENVKVEKETEYGSLFETWKNKVKDSLLNINTDTNPKELIRSLGIEILKDFESAKLLDNYDVYDFLLNYWNEKMQDDVYVIKASGYDAGREIEYVYAQKKAKDENGEEIKVDDTSKMKSFAILPSASIRAVSNLIASFSAASLRAVSSLALMSCIIYFLKLIKMEHKLLQ